MERRPPAPKPGLAVWVAMALETAILVLFFAQGSWLGVLLCLGYGYFSATWALLANRLRED